MKGLLRPHAVVPEMQQAFLVSQGSGVQDPVLIEAFRNDEDIHNATASEVYGVAPNAVDAEMGRVAKMMNFGVVYGLSGFGLAERALMDRRDAQAFIDAYFERFARVREWIEEIKESTKQRGYAETLLGL